MNKKLLATALLGLGLFPSLLFGQYYRMDIDLQNPGENRVIDRVFTGNTVGLDVGLFDGDVPFSATNWTVWFKYGDGQYATNDMQAIAGVTSSNRVVFNAVSNVFYSPNENYYFSIFGTNGAGRRATFARGRLIEEYDPAASEGIGTSSNGIYYHAVSWEIITGDPADNAALVQYVEDHGGGSAEDTVARAAVAAVSGRVDTVEGWGDHAEAGYLEDAPETGGPFARQSNGWVAVTVGSGGLSLEELQALFVSSSNDNFTVENGVGGFRIGFHGTNAFRVLAQTTAVARITSFSAGTSNLTFGFESPSGSNILWWTEIITPETVDSLEWSVYTGEVSFSWSSGIGTATVASVDLTEPRMWRVASDGLAAATNAYARFDVPAYVGEERIATMADLSIASAGSLLYASVIASDKVPLDYSVPVTTNEMIHPSEYIPAWSFDLDTGTATVRRLRVGSLADTNGNPISVGDGINSATAEEIASNVLSNATTNDMPGVDWGSLVGAGGGNLTATNTPTAGQMLYASGTDNDTLYWSAAPEGSTGWTTLDFSGTGNAVTGATANGDTLTLQMGTIAGGTNAQSTAFRTYSTAIVAGGTCTVYAASNSWWTIPTNVPVNKWNILTTGSTGAVAFVAFINPGTNSWAWPVGSGGATSAPTTNAVSSYGFILPPGSTNWTIM